MSRRLPLGLAFTILFVASGCTRTEPAEQAGASPSAAQSAQAPKRSASDLPAPYSTADLSAGAAEFVRCRNCHSLNAGGPAQMGPNLHGVFGRQAATHPGFTYSEALMNAGITWTPEILDTWLANPKTFVPGNNMNFVGIKGEEARRNLIAYLMIETATGE